MAVINPTNLKWFRSTNDLGGVITSTEVVPSTLFDTVTGDEASQGDVEYRCVYFKNTDPNTNGLTNTKVWIYAQTPGQDEITIALDLAGVGGTADDILSESIAPSPALTFVPAASKANGISIGTLLANEYIAIWMKRTVPASCEAINANSFTLKVEGDSTA